MDECFNGSNSGDDFNPGDTITSMKHKTLCLSAKVHYYYFETGIIIL